MTNCKKIMCKYNLNDNNVKRWIMVNHPDKKDHPEHDKNVTKDEFNTIVECYKDKNFCNTQSNKPKDTTIKVTKKNRAKIFSCMRKVANFSKINPYHKFDKKGFSPTQFLKDLDEASPKIIQLMNNIKELDSVDQKNHGKKFKHFIFSDVKEGGYGAKIIASVFSAMGYNNIINAKKVDGVKKLKLYLDVPNNSEKNFGLLCSNAIFGSTFNEKIKKELLNLFNSRPGNINGQKLRFIIFDSGFKEGIDLFDVKYVHIFEPSMTIADLKQTVGRATRTCGQKGLEFQPKVGWPLYVYNYYLTIPSLTSESLVSSKFLTHNITKPKEGEKDEDILLFKDVEKFNDATMLYSDFDKAMNNLSKQLFELAPKLSVDYSLTNNIHNIEDLNKQFMDKDFYLMGGGAKKDVMKNVNRKSKYFNIDVIKCSGKCGKKTSNDVPISIDFMKKVYKKYRHSNKLIPKTNQREFFCRHMRELENLYCKQLNYEWALRYAYVPEIFEKKTKKNLSETLNDLDLNGETDAEDDPLKNEYKDINYAGVKNGSLKTPKNNPMIPHSKLNFNTMRDFIKTKYSSPDYIWDKIIVENRCEAKVGEKPKAANDVELNCTQKFVSTYFCPESPYKGLLLWHSVGTGKTCTGVATASSSFERDGYTILWITRTTLKSDVWKNIFDQICHTILKEEVDLGLTIPEKLNERKKLLSDRWLEPMSYKQFSNLLLGKNKIYNILKQRNGSTDILNKTLLIIDEGHKLYGGDLKAVEKPDTNVMEKLIMNSYKKSGKDSCKLLIMTATPFTNSPLELFSLTNLFVTNESEKITTDKIEFKKQYMNSDNILSDNGVKNLANKLSGYISYLNREKDATQFSQPIMINVPVLLTNVSDEEIREYLFLKKQVNNLNSETKDEINKLKAKIKEMKAEYKIQRQDFNDFKKQGKQECSKYSKNEKDEKKQCLEDLKEEIDELNEKLKELLEQIKELEDKVYELKEYDGNAKNLKKELKERLKSAKASLLQEYMLYKKCAHVKYNKIVAPTKMRLDNNISSSKSYKSSSSVSSQSSLTSKKNKSNKPKTSKNKTKKAQHKQGVYNSFSK